MKKIIFLLVVLSMLLVACAFSTYPDGRVVISPAPGYYYYDPYPYYYYWYGPYYPYYGPYWHRGPYHHRH